MGEGFMKKCFTILFVLIFFIFNSFGQSFYGIKGGMTLGKINTGLDIPESVERKYRTGFVFGGFVVLDINDSLQFQTELLYTLKGEHFESNPYDEEVNITAIELPVLLKYRIIQNIAIYGGISFNYLLSSEYDRDDFSEPIDLLDNNLMKNTGYGVSFGAQFLITKILFDVRYDMGFSDYDDGFWDEEIKLNTIYLTAGYLF